MIEDHFRLHPDPVARMHDCDICGGAVRRVLNEWMPERDLGPNGAEKLVSQIRKIAVGLEPVE